LERACCVTMGSYDVTISACTLCTTTEFDWGPTGNSDSAGYICSKCLDLQRHVKHRDAIHTLHRQLHKALPQLCVSYIYDFVFPTSHSQWRRLNRHNYMQRTRTLQFFFGGAPWSNNCIYDLHKQLQQQSTEGLLWKGKRYYTSSWDTHTDVYIALCNFLT
jgi:hypothetical protein